MTLEVALRIDIDTYDGAIEGIPRLLDILERAKARATWFASVGPDRWGRAAIRVFTKPGFLAKMLRTRAPSMYPFKTMLRGTLLPSRSLEELAPLLRSIEPRGHEVGLHAWDHVRWQDALPRMSDAEVASELAQGKAAFERVFGRAPRSIAAPGWVATEAHLRAQEPFGLSYASDCRGLDVFVPTIGGKDLSTIQVPVTLPTLDEELGRDGTTRDTFAERIAARLRPGALNVFTLHTEAEGRAYADVFEDFLRRVAAAGGTFVTHEQVAARAKADRAALPRREVRLGAIPGRSGQVAVAV